METIGDMLDALPAPGHNRAPAIEILRDELELENEPLLSRAADLQIAVLRMPFTVDDDEMAGKFADMVKLIGAAIKASEAGRTAKKEPFLEGGRAIDGFYKKRISDPLLKIKASVEERLGVYLCAKADREKRVREEAERVAREAERAAQEAARQAAEAMQNERDLAAALDAQHRADEAAVASVAASKAAAAKPAEMARTRGETSLGTLQTWWDFDPVSLSRAELDLEALRQHLPTDALDKAIRSFIKAGGRDLRGVRIYERREARVS